MKKFLHDFFIITPKKTTQSISTNNQVNDLSIYESIMGALVIIAILIGFGITALMCFYKTETLFLVSVILFAHLVTNIEERNESLNKDLLFYKKNH